MTFVRRSAVLCLSALLAPCSLWAQGFTLQQVLSAPFNSELSAAPRGEAFVWISNQQGRRNLWLAKPERKGEGPYAVQQLTHDNADDGVQIGDMAWSPDGTAVAYVSGGDFEFPEKPIPNPAMLPEGIAQEIWVATVADGSTRKVADGREPAISPDGSTLAYVAKDTIWTISLKDAKAVPHQLMHERGRQGAIRWSPDGRWIAFESHRGDHGFVGVYSFDKHEIQYLAAATETDSDPAWSPDSRRVAFVRIPPNVHGYLYGPRRVGAPWSIVVADAATGQGREIWRADAGQGSVYRGVITLNQIAWGADDRIVFPWEAGGWTHLYSVPAEAGAGATLLTPGPFEVEHFSLSPDRHTIVYSSNQYSSDPEDADRRHVWSVPVTGGAPKQLTRGAGIEFEPVMTAEGTVAVLHSDVRVPSRPAVLESDGKVHDLAPQFVPGDFPAAQMVAPKQVLFPATDGMMLHGQLFLPANVNDGKRHPALVFFHGGSRRQMLLGWHSMEYYSNAYAENQYLTSLGYIVLSVNYRSGIGYGLDFREALHYGPTGASEFNDALGAGLYLRHRADVDPARIGAWGGSYGGYLTALSLARASYLFAAGVDMHGVHDWNLERSFAEPLYRSDFDQQAARTAWESSPMSSVKDWRSPVLLMQGDDDRNVAFAQTVQLSELLREQGTPVEEHVFPDEIHDFLLHKTWLAAYQYEADFFAKYLKAPAKP